MSIREAYEQVLKKRGDRGTSPETWDDKLTPSDDKWADAHGGIGPDPDTDDPTYDGEAAADDNMDEIEKSSKKSPKRPGDQDEGDKKIKEAKDLVSFFDAVSEAVQLDELSKKTLKSYVKKASDSMYDQGGRSVYHSTKANKANGVFADNTKKKHRDKSAEAEKKAEKRSKGISRAVDKLANESVLSVASTAAANKGKDKRKNPPKRKPISKNDGQHGEPALMKAAKRLFGKKK